MRTPERCPWCGAELVDTINDSEGQLWAVHYACGLVLSPWQSVGGESCECERSDTPAAAAYRQTLAWRKRLSQHTGVPLRMVPEPSRVSGFRAEWDALQLGVQYRVDSKTQVVWTHRTCLTMGGECTMEQCFGCQYWTVEARRRLLAKGE